MDENNNLNETGEQPPKKNPFKCWDFYSAYFATIILLAVVSWLLMGGESNNGYWMLGLMLLCIPYIIIGIIAWIIVRIKSRPIALGILFGSITPFIAIFIGTGGCGMVRF